MKKVKLRLTQHKRFALRDHPNPALFGVGGSIFNEYSMSLFFLLRTIKKEKCWASFML